MRIVLVWLFALAVIAAVSPRTSHADDGAWTKIYSRPAPTIYGIEMADDNIGLALTAAGILRTNDGGRSWTEPYPIASFTYGDLALPISETPGVVPERMQWLDAKHGFATSFVLTEPESRSGILALYRTSDGGKEWTRIEAAPQSVEEMHFASEDDGWVSGEVCSTLECHLGVLRTRDGGATWKPALDPFGGGEFFAVTRDSLLLGINQIDGPETNVAILDLKTEQWSAAASAARQPFWSIQFANRVHGYALAYGRLFVTDDGGATWARGSAPSLFDSISVSDAGTVWGATICCSVAAPIHRSVDGGKTWQPLSVPFSAVSVIQAFGADDAVGHDGGGDVCDRRRRQHLASDRVDPTDLGVGDVHRSGARVDAPLRRAHVC